MVNKKVNIELIKKYGIKCCPYCNENYIFNRGEKSGAQLDHFYPKKQYPIFAISLYNLVPSCSVCNNVKREKLISISPHDHDRNFSNMRISYMPKESGWIQNYNKMNISFLFQNKDTEFEEDMKENIKELKLDGAYENHKDYISEIVIKATLYNETTLKNLERRFARANISKDDMRRIIFGNYLNEKELLKRPLSKLTRDLLIELCVIKEDE